MSANIKIERTFNFFVPQLDRGDNPVKSSELENLDGFPVACTSTDEGFDLDMPFHEETGLGSSIAFERRDGY